MTHQELTAYLEHVAYEVTGVVTAYIRMANLNQFGQYHPLGTQGETNDCLDLMALHFRNLHEFFCDQPHRGYVRARDYTPSFTAKRNNSLLKKANIQVSHLTEERHVIAQDPKRKEWNPNDVMKWLAEILHGWSAELDQGYSVELQRQLGQVQYFIDQYQTQVESGRV